MPDVLPDLLPSHDRVLVRRIEGEDKTKGRSDHPGKREGEACRAKVIAVGEGARKETGELIPMAVKAGDRVLLGKWSGTEVRTEGDYLIMKVSDIFGIIQSEKAAQQTA